MRPTRLMVGGLVCSLCALQHGVAVPLVSDQIPSHTKLFFPGRSSLFVILLGLGKGVIAFFFLLPCVFDDWPFMCSIP